MSLYLLPRRPAGQQMLSGWVVHLLKLYVLGFIGLGLRGSEAIRRFTLSKGIEVKKHYDDLHQATCRHLPANITTR